MNSEHLEFCASDQWRDALRDYVIPAALQDTQLGDNVLEVGPGPGLTTDLLRSQLDKLTVIEINEDLAGQLSARLEGSNVTVVQGDATAMPFDDGQFSGAVSFTMLHHVPTMELQDQLLAEVARVLRSGAVFVVSDSLASADLEAFHHDDIYNPIDPGALADRLRGAGFGEVEVHTNEYGWTARALA
jgi:ubiquinone/menaquinone biosynthesis C-methylase UbiE